MKWVELEHSLPNGLHDAELLGFSFSFEDGVATLSVAIDMSTEDSTSFRDAEILLEGVVAFVVEGPRTFSEFISGAFVPKTVTSPVRGALRLDGCATTEKVYPALPSFSRDVQQLFHTLYVEEPWNSYIHIAAESATIKWKQHG